MIKCMKEILQTFFIINTGIMIGAAGFITFVQKGAELGVEILWQIIMVSLISAFAGIILYSRNELSKKQILIRTVSHYIAINIIVLACAYLFNWLDDVETIKVLSLIVCIFLVYIFVCISTYANDTKTAKRLNQKIEEYNKEL